MNVILSDPMMRVGESRTQREDTCLFHRDHSQLVERREELQKMSLQMLIYG